MSDNHTPARTPIRASDRLQDVFKRDDRLIDILASHSPHLAKLRHSPIRPIMARLTTVEQAAGICGVPAASLIRDLNRALGINSVPDDHGSIPGVTTTEDVAQLEEPVVTQSVAAQSVAAQSVSMPRPVFAIGSVIELDVRDDLRNGGEPFSKIMAAIAALQDTEVLHLRATFEPVPLFSVMEKRGLAHHAEQHGPDDWSVWFYRPNTHSAFHTQRPSEVETESMRDTSITRGTHEVWLDVRGLEPPEPMVRTLEALERLPADSALVQINVRVPQFLLPILHERGFNFEIDESESERVQVRIWRASSEPK